MHLSGKNLRPYCYLYMKKRHPGYILPNYHTHRSAKYQRYPPQAAASVLRPAPSSRSTARRQTPATRQTLLFSVCLHIPSPHISNRKNQNAPAGPSATDTGAPQKPFPGYCWLHGSFRREAPPHPFAMASPSPVPPVFMERECPHGRIFQKYDPAPPAG